LIIGVKFDSDMGVIFLTACLRHQQVKQKEATFQKRRLFLYSEGSAARSRESLLVDF